MARIAVTHLGSESFEIHTRGHTFCTDQPSPGRVEIGPTPTELFVAGIAACAGYHAERFLRRHGMPHRGVRVECDWALRAVEPSRVSRVSLRVIPPGPVSEDQREELIAAVGRCPAHNSLRQPPDISIELSDQRPRPKDAGDEQTVVAATGKG
jgi:uncharacterized OsmC-like protein